MFLLMFFGTVLVIFLILSCLPRGHPGGQANFEKSCKTIGFLDEFAWVRFWRQVQREHISEHRRTNNREKNESKNSPRDARKKASNIIKYLAKMAPKIDPISLPSGSWRLVAAKSPPKWLQNRFWSPRRPKGTIGAARRGFNAGKSGARGPWGASRARC